MATEATGPFLHPDWEFTNFADRSEEAFRRMGYRADIAEDRHGLTQSTDPETSDAVTSLFRRNLRGASMQRSQYGLEYLGWHCRCSTHTEEAIGTDKAKDILRQEARDALEVFAGTHPVAVWRFWPAIERCEKTKRLALYMRVHVMTEQDFQAFAQDA